MRVALQSSTGTLKAFEDEHLKRHPLGTASVLQRPAKNQVGFRMRMLPGPRSHGWTVTYYNAL